MRKRRKTVSFTVDIVRLLENSRDWLARLVGDKSNHPLCWYIALFVYTSLLNKKNMTIQFFLLLKIYCMPFTQLPVFSCMIKIIISFSKHKILSKAIRRTYRYLISLSSQWNNVNSRLIVHTNGIYAYHNNYPMDMLVTYFQIWIVLN